MKTYKGRFFLVGSYEKNSGLLEWLLLALGPLKLMKLQA